MGKKNNKVKRKGYLDRETERRRDNRIRNKDMGKKNNKVKRKRYL